MYHFSPFVAHRLKCVSWLNSQRVHVITNKGFYYSRQDSSNPDCLLPEGWAGHQAGIVGDDSNMTSQCSETQMEPQLSPLEAHLQTIHVEILGAELPPALQSPPKSAVWLAEDCETPELSKCMQNFSSIPKATRNAAFRRGLLRHV